MRWEVVEGHRRSVEQGSWCTMCKGCDVNVLFGRCVNVTIRKFCRVYRGIGRRVCIPACPPVTLMRPMSSPMRTCWPPPLPMKHTSPVCAYTYCTSVHTRHASGRGDGSRLNNIHDPSSTRNKAYSTTAPPFSLYKPPSSFDGRLPTFRQIPALSGF